MGDYEETAVLLNWTRVHTIQIRGLVTGGSWVWVLSPMRFGEVFVEDEAEAIVAEFLGVYYAAQLVGDVPKLAFGLFLLFLGYVCGFLMI